jgi:hypothetical protein
MPAAWTRLVTETMPEMPFEEDDMPPERVAAFVAFLMSDAADDVTGCTFRVQGEYLGLVSDPADYQSATRDGGWSPERLAEKFDVTLGLAEDLSKTEIPFAQFFDAMAE